jgi:hypothetical protein
MPPPLLPPNVNVQRPPKAVRWNEGLGGIARTARQGAALRGHLQGLALDRAEPPTAVSLGIPELVFASLPQALASDSFMAAALGVRERLHGDRCN